MSQVPDILDTKAINGDRPMTIERRMARERERMLGMTDEERAWRKKWLDAQKLAPEEPVMSQGYYKSMYNPIRRFYMAPGNKFQNMLESFTSKEVAFITRHTLTRLLTGIIATYSIYYHLKYNRMNWMKQSGWKIIVSRPRMFPEDKDMNALYRTKGNQFYVNGFDKSPI